MGENLQYFFETWFTSKRISSCTYVMLQPDMVSCLFFLLLTGKLPWLYSRRLQFIFPQSESVTEPFLSGPHCFRDNRAAESFAACPPWYYVFFWDFVMASSLPLSKCIWFRTKEDCGGLKLWTYWSTVRDMALSSSSFKFVVLLPEIKAPT